MKSYQELLSTLDWRNKRYSITGRDKNRCVNCGNDSYFKDNKVGKITKGTLAIQIGDYLNDRKILKNVYRVSIAESCVSYSSDSNTPSVVHDATFTSYDYFTQERLEGLRVIYEENKPVKILCVAESGIGYINWIFVSNLHVHHNYYQENKLPWQYPDSALVSLCWQCHEELHKNSTVPWLDSKGQLKGKLTNCSRCHGAGYIAKYSHVDNGVCYECYGKRFKEFINAPEGLSK